MPGLYLHIPFCEAKCVYCDFNSYAHQEHLYEAFVEALCADIARGPELATLARLAPAPAGVADPLVDYDPAAPLPVATIFFGGGTPSVLSPEQIGRILAACRARYAVAPDAEISMEANPGTISEAAFAGYRAAGVNRLSMGVQSFDDAMLQALSRIHTAAEAREAFHRARRAGFDNINLDLIFGLPGQDTAHWEKTLDALLDLGPDHVSAYSLIVEERTPLWKLVEIGRVIVPDEDEVGAQYERARDRLAAAGYRQYEISNWTRTEPCRHNLVYWHAEEYLGFGPGAAGTWGNRRYTTIRRPARYVAALAAGESPITEAEWIAPEVAMGEYMMLGLRLNEGVSLNAFAARFGQPFDAVFGPLARQLTDWGLLAREPASGRIRLTERGQLLGNEVFARFLPG
jgi:oxygen-independent coproporphyrinogen-3 oxidase